MDQPISVTPKRAAANERAMAVYRAIIKHKQEFDGNSPSIRDLQNYCAISSSSVVNGYLHDLARKGLVELNAGNSRSIRVVGGRWRLDG